MLLESFCQTKLGLITCLLQYLIECKIGGYQQMCYMFKAQPLYIDSYIFSGNSLKHPSEVIFGKSAHVAKPVRIHRTK